MYACATIPGPLKRLIKILGDPDLVKMCTWTLLVYHYAHIGNLHTYIMEDDVLAISHGI